MARVTVCKAQDLPLDSHTVVKVDGTSICVFNSRGNYYAIRNRCPHQGAALCFGTIEGAMMPSRPQEYIYGLEGRILACPWHGWQFNLETGRSLFNPGGVRVKTYPVTYENDDLIIDV